MWTRVGAVSVPYLSRSLVAARLAGLGFTGSVEEVDVDALMVQDTGAPGQWDRGDEVLISIRASNNFDGGEIVHLRWGQTADFFRHGGHSWDTAFQVQDHFPVDTEEVDGIEVPEPTLATALASGVIVLFGLRGRSRYSIAPG